MESGNILVYYETRGEMVSIGITCGLLKWVGGLFVQSLCVMEIIIVDQ